MEKDMVLLTENGNGFIENLTNLIANSVGEKEEIQFCCKNAETAVLICILFCLPFSSSVSFAHFSTQIRKEKRQGKLGF